MTDERIAGDVQRRPEQEVRAEQAKQQRVLVVRHGRRGVGHRAGLVGDGNDEYERADTARVADGRLHRRRAARREAHDGGLGYAQGVEQADVRVGLRLGRGIGGPRRAQVAEARHRDHAHTLLHQRPRPGHALIVAAAAAVDHQQRDAVACLLDFDRAAAGGDDHAALRGARGGGGQISLEAGTDQQRDDQSERDHDGEDDPHGLVFHGGR